LIAVAGLYRFNCTGRIKAYEQTNSSSDQPVVPAIGHCIDFKGDKTWQHYHRKPRCTQHHLSEQSTAPALTYTGIDQIVCEKTVGASYGDAFLAALSVKLDRKAHGFPLINRLA
jgi:hypothetical protein